MLAGMSKAATSSYLDPLHSIGYLSRVNFRAFSKALEDLTEPHGVSAGQWRFLRVLWEQDGITQRTLSDRVGITEATTAKGIIGLEKAGLVTRKVSKADRRKMVIKLTPRATRLKHRLLPKVVAVNERALQGISQRDIDVTRRVLARAYENLTGEQI